MTLSSVSRGIRTALYQRFRRRGFRVLVEIGFVCFVFVAVSHYAIGSSTVPLIQTESLDNVVAYWKEHRQLIPKQGECKLSSYTLDIDTPTILQSKECNDPRLSLWVNEGKLFHTKRKELFDCRFYWSVGSPNDEKPAVSWVGGLPLTNGTALREGQNGIMAECSTPSMVRWLRPSAYIVRAQVIALHVEHNPIPHKASPPAPQAIMSGMNLAVYMLDGVSRRSMEKYMPSSVQSLVEAGAIDFQTLNIAGDGTTVALLALLSGKYETEFSEPRRGFSNAQPLDNSLFIWRKLNDLGYVTTFLEENYKYAAFNYRLLGFDEVRTNVYIPGYFQLTERKAECGLQTALDFLDYHKQAIRNPNPTMTVTVHDSMTHDGQLKTLQQFDEDFDKFVQSTAELRNNTILILMSDHGPRMGDIRETITGKIEERNPPFYILGPRWWQQKHSAKLAVLRENAETRLVSQFDLHKTLATAMGVSETSIWGASLWEPLEERGCLQAGILERHWCMCGGGRKLDLASSLVKRAAKQFVTFLNQEVLKDVQDLCQPLHLSKLIAADELVYSPEMMAFSKTVDGHGRVGALADLKKTTTGLQLSVRLEPGGGVFEATATMETDAADPKTSPHGALSAAKLKFSMSQISRANKYGNAPNCIAKELPHLRPFCVCK